MDLLLVSEHFPPTAHAEAFCTGKLVLALLARGHRVHVLTTPKGWHRELVNDGSSLWRRPLGQVAAPSAGRTRLTRRLADVATRLRAGTSGISGWHEAARRAALDLARTHAFDAVMTRGNAVRTAWVGRALKRERGVPWIAYFPDPAPRFLAPPPYGAGRATNGRERRLLARAREWLADADALTFPCERLARYETERLGIAGKTLVILSHVGRRSEEPEQAPTDVRILHAGLFMKGRYPEPLFAALEDLRDRARERGVAVRLEFLGEVRPDAARPFAERGLAGVVAFPGLVDYETSLARMRSATALLVVEAPMAGGVYLPSKLCDYAVSGRPVLALSPQEGTVADVLGRGHPGLLASTPDGAARGLARFLDAAASGRADAIAPYAVPGADRFAPDAVAAAFEEQIRPLL